ncbi:MAG: hypothetical protein R3C28_14905 [Pirellulaceae bacterium]|nr:hypothetical protein [Planctomycetales bacterium]
MAFCCKCHKRLDVSPEEFIDRNAWCPRCKDVVPTSLCRVPMWSVAVVVVLCIFTNVLHVVN